MKVEVGWKVVVAYFFFDVGLSLALKEVGTWIWFEMLFDTNRFPANNEVSLGICRILKPFQCPELISLAAQLFWKFYDYFLVKTFFRFKDWIFIEFYSDELDK